MDANTSVVVTVTGPDRPGIVEAIAQVVAAHDASWQESRMAHLAGRFAGVVRAVIPESQADGLTRELRALATDGLHVVVERGDAADGAAEHTVLQLSLVGNDRPGIVREIAAGLAKRRVNVEELQTRSSAAPMAGGMLFHATARLRVPPELAVESLRDVLEGIANDLMVDLHLEEERGEDA